MKLKKIALAIVLSIVITCLAGCWDNTELNQLAFTTALGFDKVGDEISLTVQVLNPRAIAAQKSTNEAPIVVYTEKGESILEILRRISTCSPRRLTGTHMQTVIFGEEFARSGISEAMDFLIRHYQTSPELFIAVAQETTANDVLTDLAKLESNPSVKINSALQISDKVWAATKATKLRELVSLSASNSKSPLITGINVLDGTPTKSTDDLKTTTNDPIDFDKNGVFKKDKLVGWLEEEESKGYNYITGNVPNTVGYVESEETGKVTGMSSVKKVNIKIDYSNGKPSAFVYIDMVTKIENINSNFDIAKQENLSKIEKLAEEKTVELCEMSIAKAKMLKSDIFGFGEEVHISNPKYWKSVKNDWHDSGFVDLPVTIFVKDKITGTDSIGKSISEENR